MIKEAELYSWIRIEPSTSEIIVAPGSDAMSGVYLLTLQVLEQDFPFQVTIKPDDFEIEAFHQIIKTSEVESW